MLPLKNHNGQYILSLDSLDISLLSQYIQKPHDEKKMLWTRPHLDGEASYHQVEIVSEELQDEDIDLDDRETYFCHICNVKVPQKYHDEHTKSKKHHTCKKLAAKFLENIAKQINTNFDNFKNNNQRDSFYCETCSKVVSLKHKRQHEKSDYHLKCMENDKLIDNVLKMYDANKTDSENGRFSDTNGFSDSSTEYSATKPLLSYQTENIKNVTNEITNCFVKYVPKKEEFISRIQFQNLLDTNEDIMILIKLIVEECNSKVVVPIMQNNYVTIVTPNGSKEQISISTYFSYIDDYLGTHCQVCNKYLDPADIVQHIATDLHLRNILRPVNNNFTREVIIKHQFHINTNRPRSHCLLCNEIVYNELLSSHVTEKHPHLKQAIPQNINKNITSPLTKYCGVCDRNIGISNFTGHTQGRTHIKKVNKSLKKTEPNPIQEKATSTNNAKKTFCDICCIYIDTHNFLGHTKGSKHKDNIKTNTPGGSVSNNANVKNNSNAAAVKIPLLGLFCEVCNVCVPSGGMEIHIKGKPHQIKLAKNINTV